MSTDLQQRLAEVAGIAVRLESTTGVPARLLIAQWAIESRWGNAPAGEHNYFGIKVSERHKQCCTVTTREVINGRSILMDLKFADYATLEESCRDYAWLITHGDPYRAAWAAYQKSGDLDALIASVARVYATDPQYAGLVKQIAGQSNVATAIQSAQGAPV